MRLALAFLISKAARCHICRRAFSEMADVSAMRQPYHDKSDIFDVKDLVAKEPYKQFQKWFEEACNVKGIEEANAMTLATASKDGKPSVRMVLMKSFDKQGFVFYTNYGSRKAAELEENPHCSLMFYWEPLKRSVRIEGTVERIPEEESEAYFCSRPRTSQIGAMVSKQSSVIADRASLEKRNEELLSEYADESKYIPKPDCWGGYRVTPKVFEFWQGQTNRLHDRLRFRLPMNNETINKDLTQEAEDDWLLERLSP
ncbi:pyridoxine-5'-phosphate oxidase-like [Babylonia areolata]|uniref:pyridoxine-5'-phosphate oxidase-like n=1 Tax=Babylonia areolata TaxID=304850 RepID=UPI003FD5C5DE